MGVDIGHDDHSHCKECRACIESKGYEWEDAYLCQECWDAAL